MTKFKILCWILLLMITYNFLDAAFALKMLYDSAYSLSMPRLSPEATFQFCYCIVSALVTVTGLYFLEQSCSNFLKKGYFNNKSRRNMIIGGWILAAEAIVSLTHTAIFVNFHEDRNFESSLNLYRGISANILLLIIAFAMLAVADILKKGLTIKQENDLTI